MPTAAVLGGASILGALVSNKASKRATEASTAGADLARADLARSQEQARGDLFKLFPAAQQNIQQGFQGALDVFAQSLPAQTQAFQQGNVGGQKQLLAGLGQQQNALFGNQVDLSQLQPVQVQTPDLGFFQQQLPQFTDPFAPPTNADMGQGGLPPNDPFTGPVLGGGGGFGSNNPFGGGFGAGFGDNEFGGQVSPITGDFSRPTLGGFRR